MIVIRNATVKDIARIQSIKPSLTITVIEERLDQQRQDKAEFLVLEKNGEIVSFVVLKWTGKKTHPEYPDMADLYTKREERNKGYGTLLIKECEKHAQAKGFIKIGLCVNPTLNPQAKSLYENLGYKHDGRQSYVDGVYNGTKDWVIDLEKDL